MKVGSTSWGAFWWLKMNQVGDYRDTKLTQPWQNHAIHFISESFHL